MFIAKVVLSLALGLLLVTTSDADDCLLHRCELPNCRCWDAQLRPGVIPAAQTPQIVLVAFQYAVNSGNVETYSSLFDDVENPNGCQAHGTFFVQKKYSAPECVKSLYNTGHEIGMTSADGTVPADNWIENFEAMRDFIAHDVGIPLDKVRGVRSPKFMFQGDDQLDIMNAVNMTYDASCVTRDYTAKDTMLFPYTLDFVVSSPKCFFGFNSFYGVKGIWEFLQPELQLNDTIICATPTACAPYLKNAEDTYNFLYRSFNTHYSGLRTHFVLDITPDWLSTPYHVEATKRFLQYISHGLKDTWILTYHQALEWNKNPTPTDKIKDFKPWSCKIH